MVASAGEGDDAGHDWRASVAEGGLPSSSLMSPLPLHSPHRSSPARRR